MWGEKPIFGFHYLISELRYQRFKTIHQLVILIFHKAKFEHHLKTLDFTLPLKLIHSLGLKKIT